MNIEHILYKAIDLKPITIEEGEFLFLNAPLSLLSFCANEVKNKLRKQEDRNKVGWIIDRNINLSNICVTRCKFCNFSRSKNSSEAFVTTMEEYKQKISELFKIGGRQVLLQGGMNPDFGLDYYCKLFSDLKKTVKEAISLTPRVLIWVWITILENVITVDWIPDGIPTFRTCLSSCHSNSPDKILRRYEVFIKTR